MSCVTREVLLPVDADEAWETVTDLDEWLVEVADVELEPGAEGTLTLPDGSERSVVVADVEPGTRIEWWWWAGEEPATHVSLTLTPAVSGTRVVVVETGRVAGPVCRAAGGLLLAPGHRRSSALGARPSVPVLA